MSSTNYLTNNTDSLYLLFYLENTNIYAISVHNIFKIMEYREPAKMINHNNIEGVLHIDDTTIPIIDLNKLFFHKNLTDYTNALVVIISNNDKKYGIIVNKIKNVDNINSPIIKSNYSYINGFVNDNDSIIQIISIESLIENF